ncbi:hypothetical protein B9479_008271, partial [Cryptococcus floricola]
LITYLDNPVETSSTPERDWMLSMKNKLAKSTAKGTLSLEEGVSQLPSISCSTPLSATNRLTREVTDLKAFDGMSDVYKGILSYLRLLFDKRGIHIILLDEAESSHGFTLGDVLPRKGHHQHFNYIHVGQYMYSAERSIDRSEAHGGLNRAALVDFGNSIIRPCLVRRIFRLKLRDSWKERGVSDEDVTFVTVQVINLRPADDNVMWTQTKAEDLGTSMVICLIKNQANVTL